MISARAQLRVRLIATILFVAWAGRASAHDLYTAFVQHRVKIEVGAKHIDLTLDLTFFEEWSSRERQQMDADKDGRIARPEIEAYLMKNSSALVSRVKMLVAGREVPLAELYEPEVDLLGNNHAGPAHHRLRLFLFASTPSTLRAGDSLVVEERLWPDAKALLTLDGAGSDGVKIEAEKPDDPGVAPAAAGEARVFKFRCVTPPVNQTTRKSKDRRTYSLSAPGGRGEGKGEVRENTPYLRQQNWARCGILTPHPGPLPIEGRGRSRAASAHTFTIIDSRPSSTRPQP